MIGKVNKRAVKKGFFIVYLPMKYPIIETRKQSRHNVA
jgi:hypothetical protein